MRHLQYLGLLAGCLVVTLPLELVYRAGVWRRPARLARVLVAPVIVFTATDAVAVAHHLWRYNPTYVAGIDLPARLPIEEAAFFVVIPVCSILAFQAVTASIRGIGRGIGRGPAAGRGRGRGRAVIGLYTASAIGAAVAVVGLEVVWLRTGLFRTRAYWVTLAIVVGFQCLVDGWLTKLSAPIVIYNRAQFTGLRFPFDIPVEDFAYGFALVTFTLVLWVRAGGAA